MDPGLSFRYFAYGSNLWLPQIRSRCSSARQVGVATLEGWRVVYDKPSSDGSAKLNIRPEAGNSTAGVVYEIDETERQALDESEPLYTPTEIHVDGMATLTFAYGGEPTALRPYDWYVAMTVAGAHSHGLGADAYLVETDPDPLCPDIRPAGMDDLDLIQSIMSQGLGSGGDRYYAHPGEFGWWVYHDDPRYPDHFSTWLQGDHGVVVIDSRQPTEINVFTRPGVDRMPLIRWSQRRLGGRGEVGWVSDEDAVLESALESEGYRRAFSYRRYEWDLTGELPSPQSPTDWDLRPLAGEHEANTRRGAAHAAFESTMPAAMHLQRYLEFMRSPVYLPANDLVAVGPDGRVGSFMVWWPDETGIAQIEPFGTHPDFHRQGLGRALIHYGLARMKAAGMTLCRVCTDDDRPATAFYEGVGFTDVGRLHWWSKVSA